MGALVLCFDEYGFAVNFEYFLLFKIRCNWKNIKLPFETTNEESKEKDQLKLNILFCLTYLIFI